MTNFINIDGIVHHYSYRPAAESGEVIVFSNSLGTDFRIWQQLVKSLPDDFGYLLYDKRGHGLSGLGQTPYSVEMLARDLEGLLDALAIGPAHICGLSVGGLIAQALYIRAPQKIRSLILSDTASKIGTAQMWHERMDAIMANGIESIADAILERWFSADYRKSAGAEFSGYANMLVRQPRAGYVATCAALRDADYVEASRRISVPVLGLVGDEDGATPPSLVEDMTRRIEGARFELIESAGHLPCIEQPDAMAALISSFVKANAGRAQGNG